MAKRMLIDATHPEETRVAVVTGNRLDDYDYESVVRKQLKGNIYLVKVTRVEPSLQAAFVDFGGNRHGFLPFPEIHPDYYRIPVADREAILAEERAWAEAQAAREEEEEEETEDVVEEEAQIDSEDDDEEFEEEDDFDDEEFEDIEDEDDDDNEEEEVSDASGRIRAALATQDVVIDTAGDNDVEADNVVDTPAAETTDSDTDKTEDAEEGGSKKTARGGRYHRSRGRRGRRGRSGGRNGNSHGGRHGNGRRGKRGRTEVQTLSDDGDEPPVFRSSIKRRYKIQEVIKRNQIMLIQISKEERGNKGAAVTSYISLPGRYCVLMPNSPRGGGVSRKVSDVRDRQRLKKTLKELNVPDGMSVILRTAGVTRSKGEIKRDFDYLMRLWDEIRELTLKSTAPTLVHEEGNLIKRSIRDMYRREVDEVLVAGEDGYKTARSFMKTLMPSHVKKVQQYKNAQIPLFLRYQVEDQIEAIHSATVHLKSGGYIVINQTEALVAVDVNSGRATKGRHIEETALKTNIEAAEETARQLRMRDMGGLVVIDFIDMEDRRSNRIVERKLRDAMQSDRARIQMGRISPFGLLELSRQRLNASLVETSFEVCSHCQGSGLVRTVETSAVMVLRAIEEEAMRARAKELKVNVPTEVSLYIFNNKRAMLNEIEARHDIAVFIHADEALFKPDFNIAPVTEGTQSAASDTVTAAVETPVETKQNTVENEDDSSSKGNRRGRRRGKRGGGRRQTRDQESSADTEEEAKPESKAPDSDTDVLTETPANDLSKSKTPASRRTRKGSQPVREPTPPPEKPRSGWWQRLKE